MVLTDYFQDMEKSTLRDARLAPTAKTLVGFEEAGLVGSGSGSSRTYACALVLG